ncbi:hypothetical protein Sa4125_25110 [Aureimonas sp. SA4125]|uniref:hypothetical protein n=1 Tax=Aureimonas sp. SA4125 TaxID=2826993 RepID=UPI001CC72F24|nr:hypothetical protein [Aureimonas sp. SA4125]BDA84969.1 hypothetical protein Sa4125_25110 [Aureimonas sp. SA4125]
MAGNDFGGEMRMRLADGTALVLRAAVKLNTAGLSTEVVTNQNGSVSRVATLRSRRAELTIEDTGENFDTLLRAPRQDIYIVEDFTGVSHMFGAAMITGDVSQDRTNGEVTGLMVDAEKYVRTA